MIPASSSAFLRLLFAMLAAMTLGACSSAVTGPGGTISKVKYFHLQPGDLRQANQRMLTFEREHIFYGALTAQEISDRFGHYYAFFWKLDDRTGPVTVRFQYRMAKTGLKDFVQEQVVDDIRRSNISRFEVNGPEYRNNGRITMWKVTLLRGKEELVSQQSYLWN
ncbi:MAG: hypothetical protein ACK5TH_06025 [Prosthecobacter sp.]|jgi:hypothetical protein